MTPCINSEYDTPAGNTLEEVSTRSPSTRSLCYSATCTSSGRSCNYLYSGLKPAAEGSSIPADTCTFLYSKLCSVQYIAVRVSNKPPVFCPDLNWTYHTNCLFLCQYKNQGMKPYSSIQLRTASSIQKRKATES